MKNTNYSNIASFKEYNQQMWLIALQIVDYTTNNVCTLYTQNLNTLNILNSMQSVGPSIWFYYIDNNFEASSLLKLNNIGIRLYMKQPSIFIKQQNNQVFLQFIVDKVEILQTKQDKITYKISGVHLNNLLLDQNIDYATSHESPYTIITNVLKNINYPFDNIYKDTTQRIHFITYKNQTIKSIIQYCLSVGMNTKSLPMFFMQRLSDNYGMIVNQFSQNTQLFDKCNMNLQLKTNTLTQATSQFNLIKDIQPYQFFGGEKNISNLKTFVYNDFNHNTRTWHKTVYSKDKLIQLSSKNNSTSLNNSINMLSQKELLYHNQYSNYMHGTIYNNLRNLIIGSNEIKFTIGGCLSRDCGQFLTLNTNNNVNIKNNFDGTWQIYQCEHVWLHKQYYNIVYCYRTFKQYQE